LNFVSFAVHTLYTGSERNFSMTPEYRAGLLSRIFRVVVCLVTMGFVYPSALMDVENERKAAIAKTQSAQPPNVD
jgi:hypothetical protein